jgi:hypothetical protein
MILDSAPLLGLLARPALHGSGVDDVVCLVLPMILLGVVFLFVVRAQPPVDEAEGDSAPVVKDSDELSENEDLTPPAK